MPKNRSFCTFSLFLKASLGAHPFIWEWYFIYMQIKLIWMVCVLGLTLIGIARLETTRKWLSPFIKCNLWFIRCSRVPGNRSWSHIRVPQTHLSKVCQASQWTKLAFVCAQRRVRKSGVWFKLGQTSEWITIHKQFD